MYRRPCIHVGQQRTWSARSWREHWWR